MEMIDYSAKRKKLQADGEAPVWWTTGGTQLFYEKYSYKDESPRTRYKKIAKAMAKHAPEVYPSWWNEIEYWRGKTWEQAFFDVMWDQHLSPSTPLLGNGGLRHRGTTVACLTGSSQVLVKDVGFKYIEDISIGDQVLTHKGRWRKVLHVQNRMSNDDLYTLKVDTRKTPIGITGNHPVLTNLGWVNVEDLDETVHLIATNQDIEYVEVDHTVIIDTQREGIKHGVANSVTETTPVDEDLAWAFGLWYAEGSLSMCNSEDGFGRVIRVTMSQDEIPVLEKFGKIFKEKFGVDYKISTSEYKGRKWANCCINSIYLANYFGENFGTSCLTRAVPRWIIDLPRNKVLAFLKGVYEGDGRKRSGGKKITPDIRLSNSKFISQLYEMSLKCDYKVSLKLDIKDGRSNRNSYGYLSYFDGGFTEERAPTKRRPGRAIQFGGLRFCSFTLEKDVNDKLVWDITVEEDESFTVAGVVVHNCAGGTLDNSLASRYDIVTENAILTKHSHGTSCSIDAWPHEGATLKRGGVSNGIMPIIRDLVAMTDEVVQGHRRGQLAYSLRPQHGDFWKVAEYLYENPDSNNVGWLIDDDFVLGLKNRDKEAHEKFQQTLWVKMQRGKGYYTFIDKMNRHLAYPFKRAGMEVHASNLC